MKVAWKVESENMNLHEWLKVADYCGIRIESTDQFKSVLFSTRNMKGCRTFQNGILQYSYRFPERSFKITSLLRFECKPETFEIKGGRMVCSGKVC